MASTKGVFDQSYDAATSSPFAAYSNDEWSQLFAGISRTIQIKSTPRPCPTVGSPEFNKTIDHTLLKPEATDEQIDALCTEARRAIFATVCVRPHFVARAASKLHGSEVLVASVVGFPEGTQELERKMEDVRESLDAGAHELDIVLNYPSLQRGEYSLIFHELATLRVQAPSPTLLKLIFETSQLNDAEIIAACTLAAKAQFDYVKTSTGFKGHGATVEHVKLMAACCDRLDEIAVEDRQGKENEQSEKMKVKASGGVRTLEDAMKMLEAGASRLGTSAGVSIAKEAGQ